MWKIYGAHHTTLYVHIENYARTIRYNQTYRTRRGMMGWLGAGLVGSNDTEAVQAAIRDPTHSTPYQPVECPFGTHFCVILHHFFFTFSVCVLPFVFQTKKGETYRSINLSKYFNMLVFLLNSYGLRSFLFCFSPLFFLSFPNISKMKRQGISSLGAAVHSFIPLDYQRGIVSCFFHSLWVCLLFLKNTSQIEKEKSIQYNICIFFFAFLCVFFIAC